MLQDVRAEFTDELAVLVVDLNLKFRFKRESYLIVPTLDLKFQNILKSPSLRLKLFEEHHCKGFKA